MCFETRQPWDLGWNLDNITICSLTMLQKRVTTLQRMHGISSKNTCTDILRCLANVQVGASLLNLRDATGFACRKPGIPDMATLNNAEGQLGSYSYLCEVNCPSAYLRTFKRAVLYLCGNLCLCSHLVLDLRIITCAWNHSASRLAWICGTEVTCVSHLFKKVVFEIQRNELYFPDSITPIETYSE